MSDPLLAMPVGALVFLVVKFIMDFELIMFELKVVGFLLGKGGGLSFGTLLGKAGGEFPELFCCLAGNLGVGDCFAFFREGNSGFEVAGESSRAANVELSVNVAF